MSSCPQRYASKSIRTLNHLHTLSPTPEPLWFLYPQWFRLDSSHRYHTEHAPGRDRKSRYRKREGGSKASVSVSGPKHRSGRHYSSSTRHPEQPLSPASRGSNELTDNNKESAGESPRTVLQDGSLFRKALPSTVWIPKPDHIPRQEVLERRAHYIRQINPNMLLSTLKSILPSSLEPSKKVPRVVLSKAALEEFMPDDIKENTWRHYDGSSCVIKLRQGHAELHGSHRAREIAQNYLSDSRLYTRSQEHLDWYAGALHGSYLPIEDLPYPPDWTVRSFIDYVSIVTRTRIRRSAQRTMYGDDDSHHQAVFRILQHIFTDDTIAAFASTAALRLALSYCRRHTEFPTLASLLWKAFLRTGLHPDVACFNEELGRCLVGKEFTRLGKAVLEMKHLGVQPDSTTWAIVTMYTQRQSSRSEILQLAKIPRLSESGLRESLVIATAKKEIQAYLGPQDGIQRFMEQMKDRFGPSWLTSRVLERMLRACRIGNAKVVRTSEILLALKKAGKYDLIDQRCVVELIYITRKAGNLRDALGLVKLEALSPIADIPQIVIDMLFSMAWHEKYFNLCRYMWFLGATAGRVTFRMQDLVTKSLRSNTSRLEDPTDASWQLLAGKIIIGTNLDSGGFARMFPRLSTLEIQSTPVEWLLNWTPDGDLRIEQVHLGQLLVERDLNAFRFYERLSRWQFVSLLDEALALDEKWKATNAATKMSPRDLINQSLKIPLRKREAILEHQGGSREKELQRRWFIVNGHKIDINTLKYDGTQQVGAEDAQGVPQSPERHLVKKDTARDHDCGRLSSSAKGMRNPQVCGEDHIESDVEERPVAWQGFG